MGKQKAKKSSTSRFKTSSSTSKPKKQNSDNYKPKKKQWPKGNWDSGDHLSSELMAVGLRVKEVVGDGNCCFRAIGDQLEGDKNDHRSIRKKVCQYIENQREMFEPFIEDDEPFETYLKRMRNNGTWAGQIELQAASLALEVNICIYQYKQPRWTLSNFPENEVETIHISYHDGEHYNSVRGIDDFDPGPPAPFEIKKGFTKSTDWHNPSTEDLEKEQLVRRNTGCDDRELIRKALTETKGNVYDAVEKVIFEMNGILTTEDTNAEVNDQTTTNQKYIDQNQSMLSNHNQQQLKSNEQSNSTLDQQQTNDVNVEENKSLQLETINDDQNGNCNTQLEAEDMDIFVDLQNTDEKQSIIQSANNENQSKESEFIVEQQNGDKQQNEKMEVDDEQMELNKQKNMDVVSDEEQNEVEGKKKGKKSGKKHTKRNLTNLKKFPRNKPCHCGSGRKYKNCHLPIEQAKERRNEDQYFLQDDEAGSSNSVYFQEVVAL